MQNFYQRLINSAERFGGNRAIEMQMADSARVYAVSFAQLRSQAEAVGAWLSARRLGDGARCCLLGANSANWVAAYLGTLASGSVAVPLDTAFRAEQVAKLIADSESRVLFADAKHMEVAQAAIALCETAAEVTLVALENTDTGQPSAPAMFAAGAAGFEHRLDLGEDALAVILYTSGTTSDPKGVMLTHANLHAETDAALKVIRVGHKDAILGVLPLFHALAQMANLLIPLAVGCRVIYLEQLNTNELLRALREREVTLFCCVPQFFYLIHEKVMAQVKQRSAWQRGIFHALMGLSRAARAMGVKLGKVFFAKAHAAMGSNMRYLITGGSRFDEQIGRDLETLGFDIIQAYGLTETSGGATVMTPGERFIGSVGRAFPGMEVRIVDAGMEVTAGPGGERGGEICIRGCIVMRGYWNRPDATSEVLQEGWLRTGDLGHLDGDGNLFITGRKKDVIVLSSGKNVYPEEIEAHYLQSPWIKEICVLGLESRAGEPVSERLHAVIVPNMEAIREKKIVNLREVVRFDVEGLSAKLPSTKRILSYDIWQSELPRTTTRKLKRFEILKQVQAAAGGNGSKIAEALTVAEQEWMQQPQVAQALAVIRAVAKEKSDVKPSSNLELDLGLDSMERVELVVALESALGAKTDEAVISEVYTVRELIEAVRAGVGASGVRRQAGWEEVFATESDDPDVRALEKDRPVMSRLWYYGVGSVVRLLNRLMFRLELSGLDRLPRKGPFVIAPNHQSYIDAPLLVFEFPYELFRQCFYVGTSDIFGAGLMRRLARTGKLIPVDPDANLVPAMRAGSYGLSRGKVLVLFPEGERSIDGEPKMFKKGAAILAAHHNVPIYPVAMEGFHDVWPRGSGFQGFRKLRIKIGEAMQARLNPAAPEASYAEITAELKERVLEMWRPLHERNIAKARAAAAD